MTNINISPVKHRNVANYCIKGILLSPFEIEMIQLLATEDTLPVIAEKMKVCINTFETRKHKLFEKLHVLSRARLVAVSYDLQILTPRLCT